MLAQQPPPAPQRVAPHPGHRRARRDEVRSAPRPAGLGRAPAAGRGARARAAGAADADRRRRRAPARARCSARGSPRAAATAPLAWLSLEPARRATGAASGAACSRRSRAPARRSPSPRSPSTRPRASTSSCPTLVNALEHARRAARARPRRPARARRRRRASPTSTGSCATRRPRCGSSSRRGSTRRCGSAGCGSRATCRELRERDLAFTRGRDRRAARAPAGRELEPAAVRVALAADRGLGGRAAARRARRCARIRDPAGFVAAFAGDDAADRRLPALRGARPAAARARRLPAADSVVEPRLRRARRPR